jgi:hypothetical protein
MKAIVEVRRPLSRWPRYAASQAHACAQLRARAKNPVRYRGSLYDCEPCPVKPGGAVPALGETTLFEW